MIGRWQPSCGEASCRAGWTCKSVPSRAPNLNTSDRSTVYGPSYQARSGAFPLLGVMRPCLRGRLVVPTAATPRSYSVPFTTADKPAASSTSVYKLPVYLVMWYAFNIIFNITNKQGLNLFTCPWLLATCQVLVSSVAVGALWAFRVQPPPKISRQLLLDMLPVGLWHTVGHAAGCVSFALMAVSFAHVVKSAEPVFSVALAGLFGVAYPWYVWLSLVPIVAGTAISSMSEVTFALPGFLFAMASNLGMVMRNWTSSQSLCKYKEARLDGINLYGLMSITSTLFLVPLSLAMEGHKWGPMWNAAVASAGQATLLQYIVLAAVFFHLYNQVSYMVLGLGMAPVSFSVGNVMKRVCVVVATVLFFGNPMTWQNWAGAGIATAGTLAYSLARGEHARRQQATGGHVA